MKEKIVNRVPEIVISYWIIKIAATTLGETGADHLSHTLGLGYVSSTLIFLSLFIVSLLWKLKLKRFTPISYWLVFACTSLVGTSISDMLDRTLGLGYAWGSLLLLSLLGISLLLWNFHSKSLSVEKIFDTTTEIYYWSTFLISNTLGTALGDFIADDFTIGFLMSSLFIAAILILLIFFYYYTDISRTLLFWIGFVFTRPFGATFGDLLTKDFSEGGLNLGTAGSSLFFCLMLIFFIYREYRASSKAEVQIEID